MLELESSRLLLYIKSDYFLLDTVQQIKWLCPEVWWDKLKSVLSYPLVWLTESVETPSYLANEVIVVKFCIYDNL